MWRGGRRHISDALRRVLSSLHSGVLIYRDIVTFTLTLSIWRYKRWQLEYECSNLELFWMINNISHLISSIKVEASLTFLPEEFYMKPHSSGWHVISAVWSCVHNDTEYYISCCANNVDDKFQLQQKDMSQHLIQLWQMFPKIMNGALTPSKHDVS